MICKHAHLRKGYSVNIPRKSDDAIEENVKAGRESFPYAGQHYMQIWRQAHLAEARRRGLT